MTKRQSTWLAALLIAGLTGLLLWGLLLSPPASGAPGGFWAIANDVLNAAYVLVFGIVGVLILAVGRQWRNAIGWLLLASALSLDLAGIGESYWERTLTTPLAPTAANWFFLWLNGWDWWLLMGPLTFILLLFPTGRLLTRRWRGVAVLVVVTFLTFMVLATFKQALTNTALGLELPNRLGFIPEMAAGWVLTPWLGLMLLTVATSVSAILVRYRRAGPTEREQIKWFFFACTLFLAAFVMGGIIQVNQLAATANVWSALFDLTIVFIPVSIGIAILRYRLWDIDVIIRRTLIYALLTGLLALAYFGSVLVLQSTFAALTGQRQSTLVTVLSTLGIAALFVPLRRRVQAVIDQRLYRRKYDASRTLAAFGASLRDETNLDQLTAHLTHVVDETMQPASVSLWFSPAHERAVPPTTPP